MHCHCGQCRRLSGAAFTTWVSFPKTAVVLTGQEPLSVFKVTENVTRHFCRVCGSHVFTTDARLPRTLGVPAGALDGDFPLAPTAHYFVDHKAIWHHLCDELPRFGGNSGTQPTPARDSR
ncbi:hypothetical protein ASD88_09150 [Pelomonas sp. Root662]|nr:hypothetical protein ASC81_09150 [Pelomonas sp. Root405]KRA73606.1 hypothetical protein ASD88_09150 [Pelomonas sp. Root662]